VPWLSLPEYARRTGTPESTVRVAIRKGQVRAELEQRAPGDSRTVWRVWMDDPQEHPQTPADHPPEAADSPADEPPAIVTRLMDKIDERDEAIREQAARIAALEREAGELAGAVDAYRREVEWLRAELDAARQRPWWKWW
jgi:hypothetical protein